MRHNNIETQYILLGSRVLVTVGWDNSWKPMSRASDEIIHYNNVGMFIIYTFLIIFFIDIILFIKPGNNITYYYYNMLLRISIIIINAKRN